MGDMFDVDPGTFLRKLINTRLVRVVAAQKSSSFGHINRKINVFEKCFILETWIPFKLEKMNHQTWRYHYDSGIPSEGQAEGEGE